jgi:proteasome lid subunit RPN8/RPN11
MIVWNEQQPDFRRTPVNELLPDLPFTTACAVILSPGCSPLVVISRAVFGSLWDHLTEQPIEMGGLLIGRVHELEPAGSRFVVSVEDHARGEEFDGTNVSLRLNAKVWEAARAKRKCDRSVVGWYHSHPNLGAFFSGTDRRTQAAFFNQPHSLGLVVDPVRKEEKWFLGEHSDQLDASRILIFN